MENERNLKNFLIFCLQFQKIYILLHRHFKDNANKLIL